MQGSWGPGRFLWMPPSPRVLSSLSGAPLGPAQGGELRWDRDEHQLFPRLQLLRGCPSLRDPLSAGSCSALWVLIGFSLVSSVGCKEKPASILKNL